MGALRRFDLARMAWRSSLLQATWNYERQQGLGWAFALAPALERIEPDRERRLDRLAEHTAYFNTQPTMASLALGVVAGLEERRAAGYGPDMDGMGRIKNVLGASLAAIGDRLFWFTLRPLVACLGLILAMGGSPAGAAVLWVGYNLAHQGMRGAGVFWGYRLGPGLLSGSLRQRLEGLVRAWGVIGAAAVGAVTAVVLVPHGVPRPIAFQTTFSIGLAFGLIAAQRLRPTPTEWALGAAIVSLTMAWPR
jgi:PTS system mannose-specific IID component